MIPFSVAYQMEMMRNLRHVNIDHLHVGWYQSSYFGAYVNKALLDSQFNYQHSIEESIVLVCGEYNTAYTTYLISTLQLKARYHVLLPVNMTNSSYVVVHYTNILYVFFDRSS